MRVKVQAAFHIHYEYILASFFEYHTHSETLFSRKIYQIYRHRPLHGIWEYLPKEKVLGAKLAKPSSLILKFLSA